MPVIFCWKAGTIEEKYIFNRTAGGPQFEKFETQKNLNNYIQEYYISSYLKDNSIYKWNTKFNMKRIRVNVIKTQIRFLFKTQHLIFSCSPVFHMRSFLEHVSVSFAHPTQRDKKLSGKLWPCRDGLRNTNNYSALSWSTRTSLDSQVTLLLFKDYVLEANYGYRSKTTFLILPPMGQLVWLCRISQLVLNLGRKEKSFFTPG